MKTYDRSEIEVIARQVKAELGEAAAVVLIGSVARNCAMRRSDIDMLLLAEQKPAVKIRVPKIEFHRFSRQSFVEKLGHADDFPNWCVRFGVPLAGERYWDEVLDGVGENFTWPEWRRKVEVAGRRWLATNLFICSGDSDAAAEAALFALDHLIRGLLLREGEFPLSRPELVKQIRPISPQLSASLEILLNDPPENINFGYVLQPLTETLKLLDANAYQELLERFGKISAQPVPGNAANFAGL